jgi:hypothetical protein
VLIFSQPTLGKEIGLGKTAPPPGADIIDLVDVVEEAPKAATPC